MVEAPFIHDMMPSDLKVLVVDDDYQLLTLLKIALDLPGMRVRSCENGFEALLNAMMEQYDFVITDYDMPGINGIELTKRLREQLPYAVIIGMSGKDLDEKFLRAGANDFVQKPFYVHDLAMIIDGRAILV